jgi:hypothetical protein
MLYGAPSIDPFKVGLVPEFPIPSITNYGDKVTTTTTIITMTTTTIIAITTTTTTTHASTLARRTFAGNRMTPEEITKMLSEVMPCNC